MDKITLLMVSGITGVLCLSGLLCLEPIFRQYWMIASMFMLSVLGILAYYGFS